MEKKWLQAWRDLPQKTIQTWIEAIPDHIQAIIRLKGGNEYKEGIQGFKRSWAGTRIKGKLSKLQFIDQHQAQNEDIEASELEWDEIPLEE